MIRDLLLPAILTCMIALTTMSGCSKDNSMEDAGDNFLRGITNRDTALLRTVSSKKLLASVASEGWPIELTAPMTSPQTKTTWIARGKQIFGDSVAYLSYTLTNLITGQEAKADCKLRLVKETGGWKVEDLLPTQ